MTHPIRQSYFSSRANTSFFVSSEDHFTKYLGIDFDLNKLTDSSDIRLEGASHLDNWEKWLKIHKIQQDKLSAKLKRRPECMCMNSVFNSLYINQDKNGITEAINYVDCDKFRGHPNYWEVDANFEHYGEPLSIYKTIQKRYDRSRPTDNAEHPYCPRPTEREYVGIPEGIYKEKGLSSIYSLSSRKKWEESQYVIGLKNTLQEKLQKVVPYTSTPDVTDLMVQGTNLFKPEPFTIDASINCDSNPEIEQNIHLTSSEFESNTKRKETLMNVIIGGSELGSDSNVWTVSFEECVLNERYEVLLTIKNALDTVIRYAWEFILPQWVENELPLKLMKRKSKCFYFDKSDGVILPESELNLSFYFISDAPGVFHESWILQYGHRPDEWSYTTVNLSAVAVENENCRDNLKEIDSYLESCTKFTIASKILKEILERNQQNIPGELPYNWKFFEEEIFIYNNPELYYDSKSVHDLKKLHQNTNKGPWDYSVKNLRKKLMQKSFDGHVTDEIEQFTCIMSKLLNKNLPLSVLNEKTKSVYELLCCFINKLDAEGQQLKLIYKIPVMLELTHDFDSDFISGSFKSSKFSLNGNKMTHTRTSKKVLPKTKSCLSDVRNKISKHESSGTTSMKSSNTNNSAVSLPEVEYYNKTRKQEYFDALYIKIYHYLCQTVEQISLVMDSFDLHKKSTALNALKKRNF